MLTVDIAQQFRRILFDPVAYINPERFRLPRAFSTPRQRAVVNEILIRKHDLCDGPRHIPVSMAETQLMLHWNMLPYVCMLVGAHLLKAELAWQGKVLVMSAQVRFFMSLPIRGDISGGSVPPLRALDQIDVQALGLRHILGWQRNAHESLIGRMRLLFDPKVDCRCMESPPLCENLFLILQAIQYAKNNRDDV